MQLAYCDKRRNDGHLYYDATSDTDLELKVERLRDELAELGRAFKRWQNKVLRAFAVGFVLLALIGGSVWWFGYSQHQEIQGLSEEARHITKEKIRAQLLESVERTRQAALADAQKANGLGGTRAPSPSRREGLCGSISRIDELAASFAEIEGTARSSQVFDEMTRILAEEGVDQALAYAATQRAGILEKVKARAAAASEKNRTDLLPLLKSAQLQADRNQPADADRLFTDILALEPDWPDARNDFAWFLIQQGVRVEPAKGNVELKKAVEICQGTIALNQREASPQSWAAAQNNLGNALLELGKRSDGEEGRKLLESALAAYRSALEVGNRANLPQDWATTQNNLGFALYELGIRSAGEEGRKLLEAALVAYRSALEVRSKAGLPQDWALTQNNLADALYDLGTRTTGEEGRKLLRDSVAALTSALEVRTRADRPQDWAWTQSNLGNVLQELGTRSAGEEGRKLLRDAVAASPPPWRSIQGSICLRIGRGPRTIWALRLENSGRAAAQTKAANCSKTLWPLIAPRSRSGPGSICLRIGPGLKNNLGVALESLGARSGAGEQSRELLQRRGGHIPSPSKSGPRLICPWIGPGPRTIWAARFKNSRCAPPEKKAARCSKTR